MSKPQAKLKDGLLTATVWENQTEDGKIFYSTTLSRSYKKGDDWKESNSFNEDDLLGIARLAGKAYDAIKRLRAQAKADASTGADDQ